MNICISYPNGIGEKYIDEGRLALEVSRSFRKWAQLPPLAGSELAQWTVEWMAQPETAEAARWTVQPTELIRNCRTIRS